MILDQLNRKNLITPPKFLIDNTIFLVQMGSVVIEDKLTQALRQIKEIVEGCNV